MNMKNLSYIPYAEKFRSESSIESGLKRLEKILKNKNASQKDIVLLLFMLVLNPEQFPQIKGKTSFQLYDTYIQQLINLLKNSQINTNKKSITILGKSLRYELLQGWICLDKIEKKHRIVNVFQELIKNGNLKKHIFTELIKTVTCDNPLIPIDVRGEVADLLIDNFKNEYEDLLINKFKEIIKNYKVLKLKSLKEHVLSGTDSIDLPFVFPKTPKGRINLIWKSSVIKAEERIFIDIMRILDELKARSRKLSSLYAKNKEKLRSIYDAKSEYLSHPEAEEFIKNRLTSKTRKVIDYVINSNQKIGDYTISDLTRILSLCPEDFWPDHEVRHSWTAFSRSVLGFSKAANIGLGAKMIYILHGFDIPSLVYIGQATVIGKEVAIDLTGGIVIGARNFTSSFWSDTDMHGHLHIGDNKRGTGGTISRLGIEQYIMLLEDDIAFPPGLGYIEAAYYSKNGKFENSIPGFKALKAKVKKN